MRFLLLPLSLFAMAIIPTAVHAGVKTPTLHAVMFYADWCGSCKALDPTVEKARAKFNLDSKNVLFTTLDLTDALTRNQSALKASTVGLGDFYAENKGKTGFMLLVDAEGNQVGKITKEHGAGDIAKMIKENLK